MCGLKINETFTAYHRNLGSIKYKYLGQEQTSNNYNIKLLNLNDNSFTYIEPNWFNQRIITLQ